MLKFLTNWHFRFISIPRGAKRLLMMLMDAIFVPVCLWAAYVLRLADWWPAEYIEPRWWIFPIISVTSVAVFAQNRIYRSILRYVGSQTILQILKSVLVLCLSLTILGYYVMDPVIPRSVPIIFGLVCTAYLTVTRYFYRFYYQWILSHMLPKESVLIYGAGGAGVQLATALADSEEFKAVAFIDDDKNLHGSIVQGLKIHSPDHLKEVVDSFNIKHVLLAMPSVPRETRNRIINRLADAQIKVLTVPSMPEIVAGSVSIDRLKELEIEDLLGRDSIPPNKELMHTSLQDKVVMVIGAGGSIGSEICRQVLPSHPKKLILFEVSEYNLYKIEQELSATIATTGRGPELIPILGNMCDRMRFDRVVERFGIHTIYHAAAYKHVPLVEQNVFSGIYNNIWGTKTACEIAAAHKVERFVLISSDKAVRPTSIMGATKRMAELIIQNLALQNTNTIFSMVRFGNVLGSSGSVVPRFRDQIDQGGPVTVTHPEMTRYFMTISEAALLVIQAGSMATGGDVFLLEMGSKVKIAELAKQMILLAGLTVNDAENPNGDIEIQYVGLRPGEKLTEELLLGDDISGTAHPHIMRAVEIQPTPEALRAILEGLQAAETTNDVTRARAILSDPLTGYMATSEVVDCLHLSDYGTDMHI